jgi:hypothetical protein
MSAILEITGVSKTYDVDGDNPGAFVCHGS